MTLAIHAGGAAAYRRAMAERNAETLLHHRRRFTALVGILCRGKGPLARLYIAAAWRRVRLRNGKYAALWLS